MRFPPGIFRIVGAVLLAALFAAEGTAQQRKLEVVFENDALTTFLPGRSNSDREYTHGLGVATEQGGAPLWHRLLPGIPACGRTELPTQRCAATRMELGQKIFTPDYHHPWVGSPQRPFAGWLYGSMTGRVLEPRLARSVRVEAGVTGPPSLGEAFQRVVHRIAGYGVSDEGWDRQLAFEPGLLVRYREDHVFESVTESGTRIADLIPSWQITAGNVRTAGEVGLMARAGNVLPHPWEPPGRRREGVGFGFAGVRQSWTLRDLFLDGNTFRESLSVEKRPFTTEAEIGAAVEYDGVRLTYSIVAQDKLYVTQPRRHVYTTVVLSFER